MPKYGVALTTRATYIVEVEADSPEEAEDAALQEGVPSLCHQCSDVELGDWDVTQAEEPWVLDD